MSGEGDASVLPVAGSEGSRRATATEAPAAQTGRRAPGGVPLLGPTSVLGLILLAVVVLAGRETTAGSAAALGELLQVLVAAAALCAALLLRDVAPSLAWLATIGGAVAAGSVAIDAARGLDPSLLGIGPWELAAVRSSVSAVTILALGAAYALGPPRRLDPLARPVALGLLAWLVVACAVTLAGVALGLPRDRAFNLVDVATAPISWFVWFLVLVVALGVVGDVRAAAERARVRDRTDVDAPGRAGPSGAERALALGRTTLRELWPGQADLDERARATERNRLAGDLHAAVLPGLRRAIAEAESGGDPETLARQLRTIDLELERLMADRWPVVLEAFGLVAAIEELAERIEADGGPPVELEIGRVADERPPRTVERMAWRVAQVALDNAVRHAGGTAISIVIATEPTRVRLQVADDGRGFEPRSGAASRTGGRGLADAARRAAEIGATLRIEPGPRGGTLVDFAWETSVR